MKKIIVIITAVIAVLFSFNFANADIIPDTENFHPMDKCVKITNLDEFPDVYLIGYVTDVNGNKYETYIIEQDKCLARGGYKFNELEILAAKKIYVDLFGVENINPSDANILVSDERIDPLGGYIDNSNPLIKEEVEYLIAGFSDRELILFKSKVVSEYNDGTPKKTKRFPYTKKVKDLRSIIDSPLLITDTKDPISFIKSITMTIMDNGQLLTVTYEIKFLLALFLTILIEIIILSMLIRKILRMDTKKISNSRLIFTGMICSFATLPYLWFVLPSFLESKILFILFGELFVIIIEAILLFFILRVGVTKSFLISLCCNLISFLIGLIIL